MEDKIPLILGEKPRHTAVCLRFSPASQKNFFVLQNCVAPENELFLRQNVPEKGSNTDVLQALSVRYGGKRAVSQAIYPYRASAYNYKSNRAA